MRYSVYIYSVQCLKLPPSSLSFLLHEYANTTWLVESILPVFWDSTKHIIQLLSVPKWMHFLWTDWKIDGPTLTTLRHLTTSSRVFIFPMYFRFFLSMCFPLFWFVFCFCFFLFHQFILEERFADDQVQSFPAPLEDTRSGLNDPDRWTATRLVTCTICDPFFFSSSSFNQKLVLYFSIHEVQCAEEELDTSCVAGYWTTLLFPVSSRFRSVGKTSHESNKVNAWTKLY